MKLWVVGKYIEAARGNNAVWQFHGVFSSVALAEAACVDESYFVGPAFLDQPMPMAGHDWPGAYYPNTG